MSSFKPLDASAVASAGFKPLKKASTFSGRSFEHRAGSVDSRTEDAKIAELTSWAANPWKSMTKTASFDRRLTAGPSTAINEAVVVVDPFSTGAILAEKVVATGRHCIRVFSEYNSPIASFVSESSKVQYDATVQHDDRAPNQGAASDETAFKLKQLPWTIVAVLPGAETGVLLADQLAVRLGTRANPIELSLARRNKYIMGETVRAAGVRAVRQKRANEWADIEAFLREWNPEPFILVVKPIQSAGSDDVFKCVSVAEVRVAFDKINGNINGLGLVNEGALVQEFLDGDEYVIDTVSRDGVHKVTAVWRYDKRSVNNANFVYFGMEVRPAAGELEQQLIEYAVKVLDAVGIVHGPGHMEVKLCIDGPCLVEVGSRCHGGEGSWVPVATECVGYTQVDGTVAAYLDPAAFDALPAAPLTLRKFGCEIFLVSRQNGVVRHLPGKGAIAALASFRSQEWQLGPGSFARRTVDCFTRPGAVELVNADPAQLAADVATIRTMEARSGGLFDFEIICAEPPAISIVVVVDPFSTGALLAAGVLSRNYRLVLVFSDPKTVAAFGEMQHTIGGSEPSAGALAPTTFTMNADLPAEQAVAAIAAELAGLKSPIVAVLPGAETGVLLADQLAVRLGTRANPIELSLARRNKYIMGETVRAAGVRAVRQKRANEWADIEAFLREYKPEPFAVVVKPIQSAGSDDVFKCVSVAEVKVAFDKICGNINRLGLANEGALVQEFLDGDEYVIDTVSRDGVHKVTAVWRYDKRSANGTNFVYFGTYLMPMGEDECKLVEYAVKVLDAVGIVHGPGHMEVKLCKDGPCLVEVGSRCHGGEGTWVPVARECVGYSQVETTLDAYLKPAAFDALPLVPPPLKMHGCEIDFVAFESGVVTAIPGVATVRALPSFRRMELAVQPGMHQAITIDCFTRPGSALLMHADPAVLEQDVAAIRKLELGGLFEFAKE